ncbi:unnamed protein product [Moneuplotes crassus]|uniref:Uncharacterized protein n=1 Tax=Euplotes crassus TaxID=5936 RepID=A0AAD1U7Y2_EUPCR|nr:unnamed protein product [Moneuplotes crassus]
MRVSDELRPTSFRVTFVCISIYLPGNSIFVLFSPSHELFISSEQISSLVTDIFELARLSCTSFTVSLKLCFLFSFQSLTFSFDNLYPYFSEFRLITILSRRSSNVSNLLAQIIRGCLTFLVSHSSSGERMINLTCLNLSSYFIPKGCINRKNLLTVVPPYLVCKKFQTSSLTIV